MIVSHEHRYIFIKTAKTAGTSVELALARFCGPADIITPNAPEDEEFRREHGLAGPQNHYAPLQMYGWRDIERLLVKGRRKQRHFNHSPAAHIRAAVGEAVWRSYFKFSFERNPWDRTISFYYWRTARTGVRPQLHEFITSPSMRTLKERGIEAYSIDGKVVVDRVCRYENIAAELEEVRNLLKLPEPLSLPFAKSTTRSDKRSYQDILSMSDRDRIAEIFADEIELMGYEF